MILNAPSTHSTNREQATHAVSGPLMILVVFLLFVLAVALVIGGARSAPSGSSFPAVLVVSMAAGILALLAGVFVAGGFFTLEPNEAAVLKLFGRYVGTVRTSGICWANPFKRPVKVSVRARNFNSDKIKVNDKRGNPIEIAAVVVWRVRDTAQALFDVDNYKNYIEVQSESAVRHVASAYVYDDGEGDELTLRGGGEQVSAALSLELQERLGKAGVDVEEARITHLAYAPEIAQAMLRRQQAEAVIAARKKIVIGAVSMVEMALRELSEKHVVNLDEERKAAMVSNLLVVLCGESEAQPVLNTGTLYN